MQWNDNMDEAPRDGTEVLAFSVNGGVEIGTFAGRTFYSIIDGDNIPVTHWMPLPEPPR